MEMVGIMEMEVMVMVGRSHVLTCVLARGSDTPAIVLPHSDRAQKPVIFVITYIIWIIDLIAI